MTKTYTIKLDKEVKKFRLDMEAQFAVEDVLNMPIDGVISQLAFRKVVRAVLWAGCRTYDSDLTLEDAGKFMGEWSEKNNGISGMTEILMEAVLDALGNYAPGEIKRIVKINKAEINANRKAAMDRLKVMERAFEEGEPPGTGETPSE